LFVIRPKEYPNSHKFDGCQYILGYKQQTNFCGVLLMLSILCQYLHVFTNDSVPIGL